MTLHDLFTLQILLDRNIGVQYIRYTNEYIPKLQIHLHSHLIRNVFSRHNLSAQVFFSVSFGSSSSHLHLQVIFIVKSSSSSLDHHWIIIKFGSSLDLEHHWIIIVASTISIKWCYIIILLIIRSSIELAIFHAGCRPRIQVGIHLLQHLYLTMRGTHPRTMSEWPTQHLHISFSKNGS